MWLQHGCGPWQWTYCTYVVWSEIYVSLIYLRGSGVEDVRDSWSWVRGVVLELDGGRLSQIVVRMKANED